MSQPGPLPHEPAAVYQRRRAEFGDLRARLDRRARQNGNLNLGLFFGAFVALVAGSVGDNAALYWLSGILAAGFIAALLNFQRLKRQVARAATLVAISEEGLYRLARNWEALPPPPAIYQPKSSPQPGDTAMDPATAADLDLFGVASVQHLLNTPATPVGQAAICSWLLQPALPSTANTRQEAIRELAPEVDFREEVGARGREVGPAQRHYERFAAWAESSPWLITQPLLLWAARLLPLLNIGLGVAAWFWGQEYGGLYLALGVSLAISVFLSLTAGRRAGETIGQVEAQQEVFAAYAEIFDLLAAQPLAAPELRRLQAELAVDAKSNTGAIPHPLRAGPQMRRLQRLMPFAGIRQWLLFFPIEVVTLWDFHLLWLLERWQVYAGKHVRGWLAALGELEALIALATLHYDHPTWAFPTFDAGETLSVPQVEAANLAHPLLPPESAVGNDVSVGPPGSFLLITGSNMSGKSTLLRAIGVNCVLAQMGAPICGDMLRLPPLRVMSSMRVQDSLSQGVSFFMAELRSLKTVVDSTLFAQHTGGMPVLYLLDEILQGTNTAERQIAARHIIRRLVDAGAIGAVSTHDLTLAASPELAAAAVSMHFTESFSRGTDGPSMHFDYKLRPGIATSTNALKLMEIVGLT
ncbi:MAG: hypothetical protein U0X20_19515 [Caldilineaceae bacterium]